jgi:hypothetical protein
MVGLTTGGQLFCRPSWLKGIVSSIALLLCWLLLASAHTGPPTPILVDHMIGPYPVSVWADPEVGTGTFFIRLEPPSGGAIPGDTVVQIGVQPVNGRLAEAHYTARLQEVGGRVQYQAEVPFDAQELWRVRIIVRSSGGSGEATIDVETIPPGLGQWDVLLYLFPFLAVGFLGLQMVLYGCKRNQVKKRAVRRWHRSET